MCAPLVLAAVAAGVGCRGPGSQTQADAQGADAGNADADAEQAAVLERARTQTFEAAIEAAGEAFAHDDPLAAAVVQRDELSVPARTLDRLQETRQALARARRESSDLGDEGLSPKQRVNLRVLRFGLDRLDDRLDAHPPARTDPHVAIDGLIATLDELERRIITGRPVDAASVVRELADAAKAWRRELITGSPATVAAAARRLDPIAERVARLPSVVQAAPPLAGTTTPSDDDIAAAKMALVALRDHLDTLKGQLTERPLGQYRDTVLVGMDAPPRMPERLGYADLERRLRVEEAVTHSPRELLRGVEANLARLDAMAQTLPTPETSPDRSSAQTGPLTSARCEAAVARVEAWVSLLEPQTGPDLVFDRPHCGALVAANAGEREGQLGGLDDAALELALLQQYVIVPSRRATRRAQHPSVALVGGELAPWAQLHARSIAYTTPRAAPNVDDGRDPAVSRVAFRQAREGLCLAGAWLWTHAFDDATLRPPTETPSPAPTPAAADAAADVWLNERCAERPPQDWREAALQHPRAAARGLGFASFDERPDVMAGIDHFWWAPLGLTYDLSHPEAATADPPPTPPPTGAVELVPFGGTGGAFDSP